MQRRKEANVQRSEELLFLVCAGCKFAGLQVTNEVTFALVLGFDKLNRRRLRSAVRGLPSAASLPRR
jgi:hypothetical protein